MTEINDSNPPPLSNLNAPRNDADNDAPPLSNLNAPPKDSGTPPPQ